MARKLFYTSEHNGHSCMCSTFYIIKRFQIHFRERSSYVAVLSKKCNFNNKLTFSFFDIGCFVFYSSAVDSDEKERKHNIDFATSGQPNSTDIVSELSQHNDPSSSDTLLDRSLSLLSATTVDSERYFE